MPRGRTGKHALPFHRSPPIQNAIVQQREESSLYRHPMSDQEWSAALRNTMSIAERMDRHKIQCHVKAILQGIAFVDSLMGRYCSLTCAQCADPCCHGRKIFFNRADLIFLVTSGLPLPPGQTRSQSNAMCRYLAEEGCILPRKTRPYVCVWYLCEAHMSLFFEEEVPVQKAMLTALDHIRTHRLSLEADFQNNSPDPVSLETGKKKNISP